MPISHPIAIPIVTEKQSHVSYILEVTAQISKGRHDVPQRLLGYFSNVGAIICERNRTIMMMMMKDR
jgi:hypothetical protein